MRSADDLQQNVLPVDVGSRCQNLLLGRSTGFGERICSALTGAILAAYLFSLAVPDRNRTCDGTDLSPL